MQSQPSHTTLATANNLPITLPNGTLGDKEVRKPPTPQPPTPQSPTTEEEIVYESEESESEEEDP